MGRQFHVSIISLSLIVFLNAGFTGVGGAEKTPRLLFANRKDIRLMDTGTKKGNSTIIVRDLIEATSVDVNLKSEVICWSDIKAEKIQCQKNGKVTTLVSTSLPAPEDIALDSLTNKLYWTDSENNHIEIVCLDSKLRKVLIWEEIDQPRAIVLDTNVRTMFWSDWGENPKIERASMDGTNRRPIIDKDIFWPNGIALDYRNKVLYWVDAKLHYIASVDYNGSNRKLINQDGPLHPFMLAYYQNVLYWSDWHTNSLHSIRLDTNQIRTLPTKANITPMDIVIFEEPDKPKETNPCADAKCSHICLLSESTRGFKCACPVGVKLLNDGTICNNDIESFLIVARGTDIRRISLDTTDYTDVLLGFTGIKHLLTVDYWNGSVFWTDDEARKIRAGSLTTFETVDIIKEELVHPDSLAIDWVGQNLYWTDAGTDRIEVAKLTGKFRKILISRGLTEPRAIGLDPSRGLMFWSDWGKKPRIERANMDGTHRESIITENIFWPNGLALDNGILYWCDAKSDKIELADYDGKNRRELLTQDVPHTFGFSLLGDYIYWTDWQRRTVERAEKTTGHDRIVIKEQFMDPMGIVAVSPKSYNYTLNPCHIQIQSCQHLCLFNGDFSKTSHCACASGYELSQNNKSCTNPEAFILYSNNGEIHRISLTQSRSDVIPVKAKSPGALDYDSFESRIYWTDSKFNSIHRAFMNGSDTERLLDTGIKNPEGLAIDWLNRNMYWTDMGRHRIEVSKLNGDFRRTLIWENIDSPRSIIVQPNKAWLYWSSWSENPSIEKSSLDGSKRISLVSRIGRAYGLALDSDYLYWSDIDNYIIERLHLATSTRSTIVSAGQMYRPFSIATYNSWLYWQDTESSTIYRLPTNSSKDFPIERVHSNIKSIQELKIYDKLKQSKTTWTPCSVLNCSHLCFTVQGKTLNSVCGCPNHYLLKSGNENTCTPPEEYLLFSSPTSVSRFLEFDSVIFGGLKNVTGVSADRHFIYVLSEGVVKRYKMEDPSDGSGGSGINILAENATTFVLHGRLIFYASANCINISSTEGNYIGNVYCSPRTEEAIQLLKIYKSFIYFVAPRSIERVTLNGIGRAVIINGTLGTPKGLEIDEDLLYWSEGDQIFVSNLAGTNVKVLGSNNLGGPGNLAILGRWLYWIDGAGGGIERMEKFSGLERSRVLPRSEVLSSIVYVNLLQQEDCNADCTICTSSEGCTCPGGQILAQDGRRCLMKQDCPVGHFRCVSGHIGCIPAANQCNGVEECQDGSDETDCFVCATGDDVQCRLSGCKGGGEGCVPELAGGSSFDPTYLIIPVVLFVCIGGAVWVGVLRRKRALGQNPHHPSNSGSCAMNMSSTTTTHLHHHAFPLDSSGIGSGGVVPPIKYTNNSSSSSSNYNELLVPHPSPVTTTHSYCCHGSSAAAKKYYYLQSKELAMGGMGPCPTPCSTDVCDNSDIYNFSFNAPPPSITSSPNSTLRMYIPPPPSPS